jgi:hypothetical protein
MPLLLLKFQIKVLKTALLVKNNIKIGICKTDIPIVDIHIIKLEL